jgi:hypothetical protein
MRKIQLLEAQAILNRLLPGILACVPGPMIGRQNADLRRAIGDLQAIGGTLIQQGTLGPPLIAVFNLAVSSGATYDRLDQLRAKLIAESPQWLPGIAVAQLGTRLTLIAQSVILTTTTYVSRQDADRMLVRMTAAFEPAVEDAADSHDAGTYQAIIALQGAITRYLFDNGLLLPRVVPYEFPAAWPSLVLAQRLYPEDALTIDRSQELRKENKVVHPAFMPTQGICLSS